MNPIEVLPMYSFEDVSQAIDTLSNIERNVYPVRNPVLQEDGFLKFETQGPSKTLPFSVEGFRRYLKLLKIPNTYATKIISQPLLHENVKERTEETGSFSILTENHGDGEIVVGFNKKSSFGISDFELLKVFNNFFEGNRVRQLVRSDNGLRLHYYDPNVKVANGFNYNGDAISLGGDVAFSEYDKSSFELNYALLILICTNGAVMKSDKFPSFSVKTNRDPHKLPGTIYSTLSKMRNFDSEVLVSYIEKMRTRYLSNTYYEKLGHKLNRVFGKDWFSENFPDPTFSQVFDEVTRLAHEDPNVGAARRYLEVLSGDIFVASDVLGNYRLTKDIAITIDTNN